MNEASARQVLLLQALETVGGPGLRWTAQDSAWASRAALESTAAGAAAHEFVAERARHAMHNLAPREPAVAGWLARRWWPRLGWVWAAGTGLLAGGLADAIGGGQRINLLAPPVWGVVVWNLLVYALLLWGAARAAFARRAAVAGPVMRGLQAWLARVPSGRAGGDAAVAQAFTLGWARHSAPLTTARAAGLLHTAAAALGLGLLAGLYARGLVLDYRAGWESTFLNAGQVHAALSWLMAPAVALSGIAVPDAVALEALRFSPAQPLAGASAAPWIHLYAVTLTLFVVLPRAALALWSGWRARRLTQHFPLALDDPYFQRLLRHRQGGAARVQVLPYAHAPAVQAEQGLRAVFAQVFGDAAQVQVAPVVAFGAEDEPAAATWVPTGTTLVVALFDLTATPEVENQGRFVERLLQVSASAAGSGQRPGVVMLIDEAAFAKRFGASGERIAQRRAAWRALAEALGTAPVFVNLAAPDLPAAEQALQTALGAAPRALAGA